VYFVVNKQVLIKMKCPCGNPVEFGQCCGAIHSGKRKAETAEQLMRSRYSAYVTENVDYLVKTTWPKSRTPALASSIRSWMNEVQWLQLHVLGSTKDTVEFIAEYVSNGQPARLHEHSYFKMQKGEWFYVGEVGD
jgi:SEC-C motif-containing protein